MRKFWDFIHLSLSPNETRQTAIQTHKNEYCSSGYNYPKLTLTAHWLTTIFTGLAFLAAAYYACQAERQAHSADITAQQAIEANRLAQDNVRVQLRAYVDPGSSKGSPMELIQDKKGKVVNILLNFPNAGSTPARHFAVRSWADIPGGEPPFRTRYLQETTTGLTKGFPFYTFGALAPSDASIPAGGKQSVSLPYSRKSY